MVLTILRHPGIVSFVSLLLVNVLNFFFSLVRVDVIVECVDVQIQCRQPRR